MCERQSRRLRALPLMLYQNVAADSFPSLFENTHCTPLQQNNTSFLGELFQISGLLAFYLKVTHNKQVQDKEWQNVEEQSKQGTNILRC